MTLDLTGSRARSTAMARLDACIEAAQSEANRHTFISPSFEAAAIAAQAVDARRATGEPVPALADAPASFSPLKAWAWHRHLLATHETEYAPRVAMRIGRGAAMRVADCIDLLQARRAWIAKVEVAMTGCDAILSATMPIVVQPIAPLAASDDAVFDASLAIEAALAKVTA